MAYRRNKSYSRRRGKSSWKRFVKKVRNAVEQTAEKKNVFNPIVNGIPPTTTIAVNGAGFFTFLQPVLNGTADGQRIGNKIRVHTIAKHFSSYWRFTAVAQNTFTSGCAYIHMAFARKGLIGAQGADLNANITAYLGNVNNVINLGRLNPIIDSDTTGFFITKSWKIGGPVVSNIGNGNQIQAPLEGKNNERNIKIKIFRKNGMKFEYGDLGNTYPDNYACYLIVINTNENYSFNLESSSYMSFTDV